MPSTWDTYILLLKWKMPQPLAMQFVCISHSDIYANHLPYDPAPRPLNK